MHRPIYPDRHKLIIGDSTKTVPQYNRDTKFEFIFIDCVHDYEIANSDMESVL